MSAQKLLLSRFDALIEKSLTVDTDQYTNHCFIKFDIEGIPKYDSNTEYDGKIPQITKVKTALENSLKNYLLINEL